MILFLWRLGRRERPPKQRNAPKLGSSLSSLSSLVSTAPAPEACVQAGPVGSSVHGTPRVAYGEWWWWRAVSRRALADRATEEYSTQRGKTRPNSSQGREGGVKRAEIDQAARCGPTECLGILSRGLGLQVVYGQTVRRRSTPDPTAHPSSILRIECARVKKKTTRLACVLYVLNQHRYLRHSVI